MRTRHACNPNSILALALFLVPGLYAQRIEVSPFVGVRFGGRVPVALRAADPAKPDLPAPDWIGLRKSPSFGLAVDYRFSRYFEGEILWSHQRTGSYAQGDNGEDQGGRLAGVRVNQFHGNLLFHFAESPQTKIRPYLLFGAGAGAIAPTGALQGSSTTFGFGLGAGVKAYFNRRLGLRVQFRYAPTKYDTSRGTFWCAQSGSCYTVTRQRADFVTIPNYWNQYDFSFGPIFRF